MKINNHSTLITGKHHCQFVIFKLSFSLLMNLRRSFINYIIRTFQNAYGQKSLTIFICDPLNYLFLFGLKFTIGSTLWKNMISCKNKGLLGVNKKNKIGKGSPALSIIIYSWPLNNMGLNCIGLLICKFFLMNVENKFRIFVTIWKQNKRKTPHRWMT